MRCHARGASVVVFLRRSVVFRVIATAFPSNVIVAQAEPNAGIGVDRKAERIRHARPVTEHTPSKLKNLRSLTTVKGLREASLMGLLYVDLKSRENSETCGS
jgi:hypothetical protein